jgi:hypothetical protein
MKLTRILPIEKTYLEVVPLSDKIRLSREMVRLNYLALSPFSDGDVQYVRQAERLLLWFTPETLHGQAWVCVPEAYLLHIAYPSATDTILLMQRADATIFLVRKGSSLLSQVIVRDCEGSEVDVEKTVLMLQREYSLVDAQVINVISEPLKPRWPQLLECAHFDWRADRLLPRVAEECKLPAILFMLILCLYGLGAKVFLEHQLDSSRAQLLALKEQNRELNLDIESTLLERDFWQGMHDQITSTPDFYRVMDGIATAAKLSRCQIVSVNYRGEEVRLSARAQGNENDLVSRLLDKEVFREVQLISSRQSIGNRHAKDIEVRLLLMRRSELISDENGGAS